MSYKHITRSNLITDKIFAQQVQYLKTYGECHGIIDKRDSLEVYYSLRGTAYRVLYESDRLIRVTKISIDEMNRILACANCKFGD